MVRVSLVHDWIVDLGGAERCLQSLHRIYPEASLYTLFYCLESLEKLGFNPQRVYTSGLQSKPHITENYRRKLPFFPYHIEQFEFPDSDIIISSSHCAAKGIKAGSEQLHICYCHTPATYAWDFSERFLNDYNLNKGLKSTVARWLLHYLRIWDAQSSNRVDHFVASSRTVAQRIWRAYRRRAQVVYPPVEVEKFKPHSKKDNYFLFVSRLVPSKMAPLVIETFNRIGQPLIVVGGGPQLQQCQQMADKHVEVLGYLDGQPLVQLMRGARALIFPAEDAFGIVTVEAQAAGTPVIAYSRGGARETVVEATGYNWDEATGVFFNAQKVEAMVDALKQFKRWEGHFRPEALQNQAMKFSRERFEEEMKNLVWHHYQEWREERVI